jgi:hypothetical protein
LLVAGCAVKGERGQNGCPVDETCAPLEGGVVGFVGTALSDFPLSHDDLAAPQFTAVGGTQVIRVLHGPFVSSPPFELPFTAATRGDALAIERQSGPDIGIAGVTTGSAYLRILEPETGDLYDRILLMVAPVARARLAQPAIFFRGPRPTPDGYDWMIWAGRDVQLVVALETPDGHRVVDDSMSVNGVRGEPWDLVTVNASPGTVTVTVDAGGETMAATGLAADVANDLVMDSATPRETGSSRRASSRTSMAGRSSAHRTSSTPGRRRGR